MSTQRLDMETWDIPLHAVIIFRQCVYSAIDASVTTSSRCLPQCAQSSINNLLMLEKALLHSNDKVRVLNCHL